jgi:hypothetical protein
LNIALVKKTDVGLVLDVLENACELILVFDEDPLTAHGIQATNYLLSHLEERLLSV